MEEDISEFLHYLEYAKNVSIHTLRAYKMDLEDFQNRAKLSTQEIRKYIAELYQKGLGKRSIARKISTLRSFCKYLLQEKKITKNPCQVIATPKLNKSLPKFLPLEQVMQFLQAPDTNRYLGFRDRAIMELLYSSAIRVSELCSLNRADFDPDNRLIKVYGKGGRERIVPVTKNASFWLENYLSHKERCKNIGKHKAEKDSKAIFLNRWGKRLTTRSVERFFLFYKKKSGIALEITPHTLRHTIATHFLQKGMDLKTIQKILGHKSLKATAIYTHITDSFKEQVYQKSHPFAQKKS